MLNMKDIEIIITKLKEIKPDIEEQYNIREIGVFGSFVRDEQTDNSDIDILIDFARGMTLIKFNRLENLLSNLLGRKVDLVSKKGLKPTIGANILKEVIYL